ncbi:MAG: hypothetical protein WCQ49_03365 [Candidatus Saccharibacteria bacterium]
MSHPNHNEDKQALAIPDTVSLTTAERIEFIANLIVERIAEDEITNFELLKKIKAEYGPKSTTT